jgi:hypothetical protein
MRSIHRLFGFSAALVLTLALGAAPAFASESFRTTAKVSFAGAEIEFPENQPPIVHITFLGKGTIVGVGRVSVVTLVSETQSGGCLPSVVTHTLTGADFTLEITSIDEICPHPSGKSAGSKIVGNWTVTGGTGTYAGASGSGTSAGVIGGQGNVPFTLLGQITR